MDLWGGKFSSGIEHHLEDLCQTHPLKIGFERSVNKIQSAAEKVPYESALLAEPHCAWHCLDPFLAVNMQVNSFSRMGIGYHAGYRSPRVNDEIQVVTSIDETKDLQIPYKPNSSDRRHLDPAHWALDCRLIGIERVLNQAVAVRRSRCQLEQMGRPKNGRSIIQIGSLSDY